VNSGAHCTGPFTVSGTIGTYVLGAGVIGSVYRTGLVQAVVGPNGTSGCDGNTIDNAVDCQAGAGTIPGSTWIDCSNSGSCNWPWWPAGCVMKVSEKKVWYNEHDQTNAHTNGAQVCLA
jgi:hypothetical protein